MKAAETLLEHCRRIVDRRIQRQLGRPVSRLAARFDHTLEQGHVQTGNGRKGKHRRLRHGKKACPRIHQGPLRLRSLDKMANHRVAALRQEVTARIVAAAEMRRDARIAHLGKGEKVRRDRSRVHGVHPSIEGRWTL
ncbi:hypothetical protein D3C72_1746550 [compost metagenome]